MEFVTTVLHNVSLVFIAYLFLQTRSVPSFRIISITDCSTLLPRILLWRFAIIDRHIVL
jgi:hypothetical protein